ncbi:MAG: alpha/beta hydrolase [Thermotogota bacterium]|nr:alpha/beta hydrolase [Thermotogota bacterium]
MILKYNQTTRGKSSKFRILGRSHGIKKDSFFKKLLAKIKKSYFMVNKFYLWLFFFVLLGLNAALAFAGVVIVFVIFLFTRRVPLEPKGPFHFDSYVYKQSGNLKLKLDCWYPKERHKKNPVVFFAHGGGWISGFRNQPNNVSWSKYLASKGFSVVSIDYRYGINNSMEDILEDYSDALEFVRERSDMLRLDTSKIVLMGLSAGGHLALLYAAYYTSPHAKVTKEERGSRMMGVKAVVAFYAPSDLKDIFEKDNKSLFARFATRTTLKGLPDESDDVYRYYSPIYWVTSYIPPIFLAHGKDDTVVPCNSSIKLAKKLKICSVDYKFYVHKRGNHAFEFTRKDFKTIKILESAINFLKSKLSESDKPHPDSKGKGGHHAC